MSDKSYEAYSNVFEAVASEKNNANKILEYRNKRLKKLDDLIKVWRDDSIGKEEKCEIFQKGWEYCNDMVVLHNELIDVQRSLHSNVRKAEDIAYEVMKENRKVIKLSKEERKWAKEK